MESETVGRGFSPAAIEQRLEKLEKEAGHWRRMAMRLYGVSLALGAMLILMFALAATKPAATQDVIRAKKLEIVDENGNTRMSLVGFDEIRWGPQLNLFDDKGNALVSLDIDKKFGPSLRLMNEKSKRQAQLNIAPFGTGLQLYDENGKQRAWLSVGADGADLRLLDKGGKVVWQAPPTGSGLPAVAPK